MTHAYSRAIPLMGTLTLKEITVHCRLIPAALFMLLTSTSAALANEVQVMIKHGDVTASGPITLDTASARMTETRIVGFMGAVSGLDTLFTLSDPYWGTLHPIIQEHQSTPAGDGRVNNIDYWHVADDGGTQASVRLENVTQYGIRAIYRNTGSGSITELIRDSKPLGPGLPTICETSPFANASLAWQRSGVLHTNLSTAHPGSSCQRGIWRIEPGGTATRTVAPGAPILGTTNTLSGILYSATVTNVMTSDDGSVVFAGEDTVSSSTSYWYLLRPTGLQRVAPYRLSDDRFFSLGGTLTLHNGSTSTISQYVNGSSTANVVFARGQTVPGGTGQFYSFSAVDVSEDGRVLVVAQLTGTPNGTNDDTGVYLWDTRGIVEIAREGRVAPGAGSTFVSFLAPSCCSGTINIPPRINGRGQVMFGGRYTIAGQADTYTAVFHYDRKTGLAEALNGQTPVDGTTSNSWRIDQPITRSSEVAVNLRLTAGNRRAIAALRFDALFASGLD